MKHKSQKSIQKKRQHTEKMKREFCNAKDRRKSLIDLTAKNIKSAAKILSEMIKDVTDKIEFSDIILGRVKRNS